jgi:hypothetical protein
MLISQSSNLIEQKAIAIITEWSFVRHLDITIHRQVSATYSRPLNVVENARMVMTEQLK